MSFEQNIQQWVSIDNQIKLLNDKIHELREKKSKLGENITTHVEQHDLRNATVQISDGKLRFVNTKVSSPLTFKYLEKSLGEVIKNQTHGDSALLAAANSGARSAVVTATLVSGSKK